MISLTRNQIVGKCENYMKQGYLPEHARYCNVNGSIIGSYKYGTAVLVYETRDGWSRVGTNRWVSSSYLTSYMPSTQTPVKTISGLK